MTDFSMVVHIGRADPVRVFDYRRNELPFVSIEIGDVGLFFTPDLEGKLEELELAAGKARALLASLREQTP